MTDIWHIPEVSSTRDQTFVSLNRAHFGITVVGWWVSLDASHASSAYVREGISTRNAKRTYFVPFGLTFLTLLLLATRLQFQLSPVLWEVGKRRFVQWRVIVKDQGYTDGTLLSSIVNGIFWINQNE